MEAICRSLGQPISRWGLPGTKKLWLPIFAKLAPSTSKLKLKTLAEHFRAVGLKWVQGLDVEATSTWKANMRTSGFL